MKLKLFIITAALGLSAGVVLPGTAGARPHVLGKKAAAATPARGAGPASIEKKLALSPKGVRFGISLDELSRIYAGVLDQEYNELYKRVEPGPRMQELDHELADKKQLIKRNWIEFGTLPSGLDKGPLGGEFTYRNNESMTRLTLRNGAERHFFFFNKRLWKIFDEHKLDKNSALGKSYDEVIENLTKKLGKKPRLRAPDAAHRRLFDSADWTDGATILRVYDLGGDRVAVMYIEENTENNLHKFRTHHNRGGDALDAEVRAVTREDAPPPAEETPKRGKKR
jgi:hypothetical protein